jgi:hypothetical protein
MTTKTKGRNGGDRPTPEPANTHERIPVRPQIKVALELHGLQKIGGAA